MGVARQPDCRDTATEVVVVATKRRILDFHVFRERGTKDRDFPLQPKRTATQPSKIKQQTTFLTAAGSFQSSGSSVYPDGAHSLQTHIGGGHLRTSGQ